jgi:hypothetical protein
MPKTLRGGDRPRTHATNLEANSVIEKDASKVKKMMMSQSTLEAVKKPCRGAIRHDGLL